VRGRLSTLQRGLVLGREAAERLLADLEIEPAVARRRLDDQGADGADVSEQRPHLGRGRRLFQQVVLVEEEDKLSPALRHALLAGDLQAGERVAAQEIFGETLAWLALSVAEFYVHETLVVRLGLTLADLDGERLPGGARPVRATVRQDALPEFD